jgi:hypothetical protein
MKITGRRSRPARVAGLFSALLLAACGGGGSDDSLPPGDPGANWSIPRAEVVDGGPGQDGIPAIDHAKYAPPDASEFDFLLETDYVVGIYIDGEYRAYPHMILHYHEIVNETVSFTDFVLSYCPLTGSAVAWDTSSAEVNTEFGVSGFLYESNLILYDRATGSHWSQMLQKAVRGSRIDEVPDRFQVIETTWSTWKAMYPDSKVLSTDNGHEFDYFAYPYGTYRWDDRLIFPVSNLDNRLHPKRRVIGITSGAVSKVYQIDSFGDSNVALHENINGEPVVVIGNSAANLAAIYSRELADGTVLQFSPVQDQLPVFMTDTEGNLWDIFGVAVEGPRAGTRLEMTTSYTAMFFAWATFFDNTQIHFN